MLPLNVFVLAARSSSHGVFAELLHGSLFCTWACLVYSSLCCHLTCLFCSSLCCPWTCLFYCNLSWAYLCVPSTVQQSVDSVLSPEVSVLQQLVLHLDVSVQQQPVLCQKMAYSSLWCTWTVCLQEPVLQQDVSVYTSLCMHLM